MTICKVIGHVWATKKEDSLNGLKLMIVQDDSPGRRSKATYVAADTVGAGDRKSVV